MTTPKPLHILASILMLTFSACSDDVPVIPAGPETPALTPDDELLYHDYVRQDVYPKLNNEVYLNPPPLQVPSEWRGDSLVQFQLAGDPDFNDPAFTGEPHPWVMASPHLRLEPGRWYWRYRNISPDGAEGLWSRPIPFDVPSDAPVFVTPSIECFNENLPSGHPRLEPYLDTNLEAARARLKTSPEYKNLIGRASTALNTDFSDIATFYSTKANSETLNYSVLHLYQAWTLTLDEQYAGKMHSILNYMLMRPASDTELFKAESNFIPTNIAQAIVRIYDSIFDRLSMGERAAAEDFMLRIVRRLAKMHMGKQESNLFDSHFWQHNMLGGFQCAYMLYDNARYRDEILPVLDFYYELWTTRAPATGYNRDGIWHNSASYFDANMDTLHYMPLILSYITGFDFLSHPWYMNAGKSIVYSWPSGSRSLGFGDASDEGTPSRLRVAMADFLARNTGNEYAGWYAAQNSSLLYTDFIFRLERMVNNFTYSTSQPDNMARMLWYKDSGEAVIHSDIADQSSDLAVSFRSSRFGCAAHTYANQNAFNIVYRGQDIFRNTGHYYKYGSPHHIMDYRHTRAHNTILVDGIGQAFEPKAFGNIVRGIESDHIAYLMGDASHAYTDSTTLDAWLKNLSAAHIDQTPENGFGKTPLSLFHRHLLMLADNIVVIYDDIAADEPCRINWLLNRREAFAPDADGTSFTITDPQAGFAADASLSASSPLSTNIRTGFICPTPSKTEYPDHWHYSATSELGRFFRFLFVLRVRDNGAQSVELRPDASGTITIDGWTIKPEMDASQCASLSISNTSLGVTFSLGSDCARIHDTVDGVDTSLETIDYTPLHTRSL